MCKRTKEWGVYCSADGTEVEVVQGGYRFANLDTILVDGHESERGALIEAEAWMSAALDAVRRMLLAPHGGRGKGGFVNHLDLAKLKLRAGNHSPNDAGEMCVMEAVAHLAREPWSDRPKCASQVLTDFCMAWNDAMNDKDRQILKPFIPRLVGTAASAAVERQRAAIRDLVEGGVGSA